MLSEISGGGRGGGGELAKQIVRCLVLTLIGRCALNGVIEKSITRARFQEMPNYCN